MHLIEIIELRNPKKRIDFTVFQYLLILIVRLTTILLQEETSDNIQPTFFFVLVFKLKVEISPAPPAGQYGRRVLCSGSTLTYRKYGGKIEFKNISTTRQEISFLFILHMQHNQK